MDSETTAVCRWRPEYALQKNTFLLLPFSPLLYPVALPPAFAGCVLLELFASDAVFDTV